jgi:MFS family permease
MRLRIYLDVLRVPSVTRLLSSAVVGRMPTGMAGLAIVLLVREAGASYAVAGMVAGTYSAALALSSPLLGRLVDRVGQTRVLVGCAVASALSFGALAAAGGFASPVALAGLAALAGASIPPVGACMRALWSELLGDHGQLQAAFAVESTVQELIFVIGPPLVALLAASFSPRCCCWGWGCSPPPRCRGPGDPSAAPATGPGRCAAPGCGRCWPPSCCWPSPSAPSR